MNSPGAVIFLHAGRRTCLKIFADRSLRGRIKSLRRAQQRAIRSLFLVALFAALTALAGVSDAAEFQPGDPVAGRIFSEKRCAECHAILVDAGPSPNRHAPRFPDVAKQASTTEMSLRVFLRSTHKRMPDLRLTVREQDDVIAYILSLKPN